MSVGTHRVPRAAFDPMRALALLSTAALLAAFAGVLYGLVDVAGDTTLFAVVLLASLLGGTVLAPLVRARVALFIAVVVLAAGMVWYVVSLGDQPRLVPLLASNAELLAGQSLHQIRESGTWAVAVTPAPVLVTWYLALRRRYVAAAAVGGLSLGYLVLTGDAVTVVTVLGLVGIAGLLGFGDLDRRAGTVAGAEHVAVVLAVMVVLPFLVTVVPGGTSGPLALGGGGPGTLEESLLEDRRQISVSGEVRLSPNVRFTVESPVERYWKTNSYDRYTGNGWVRTGGTVPLTETALAFPPGPRQTVRQTVEVETSLSSMPAAWKPIDVGANARNRTLVSDAGDLTARDAFAAGESYTVTSAVSADLNERLKGTDADYPERIRERYTQLPASTPDRIGERTAALTGTADGPYETAVAIESWLEANRGYSLSVDRPDGAIADAFLFDMDEGYCTYFATTMVVMLRSEGVPARLATGYTTGQQVDEDRYVVRGLDAHSWVEVYGEDHGWVTFDPTPSGPREVQENLRLNEARQNNATNVDTAESEGRPPTEPATEPNATDPATSNPAINTSVNPESLAELEELQAETADEGLALGERIPPREHLALGAVVLVGAVAGLRRSGAGRWLRRSVAVRWQRRVDPGTDVERAFERTAIVLERRHRPRHTGETVRAYLDAIDAPASARRVAAIRERARYAGTVDQTDADEAVALVDELRAEDERP